MPIWLLHRYQLEAAAKLVGGVDFAYALNGDGRERPRRSRPAAQRRALDALIDDAGARRRSPCRAALLPYLSAGWSGNPDRQETIEIFRTAGGPVFDPLVASEVAAAADPQQSARRPSGSTGSNSRAPADADQLAPDDCSSG